MQRPERLHHRRRLLGRRLPGQQRPDCGDGKACTADLCDPATGCHNPDLAGPCNDGDICTLVDACDEGECVGSTPLGCDDGDECTDDSCDSALGCLHTPNSASCNDGDACTTGDTCVDGACEGTGELVCGDGLFCNGAETCDSAVGCVDGPDPELGDGVDCTVDTCDEDLDAVVHTPSDEACDDELWCNGAETCDPVLGCQDGADPDVSDGVDCTVDTCDEDTDSAVHTPDDGACPAAGICQLAACDPGLGCQLSDEADCCGNGVVEDGEACDDGNDEDLDGCLSGCVAPASCKQLLDLGLSIGDAVYVLDPDGAGGEAPFDVWCDMTGGGWTLVTAWSSGLPAGDFGTSLELSGEPGPTVQHAVPFLQLPGTAEFRMVYLGSGAAFSAAFADSSAWEQSGKSTRRHLADGRYLVFDGQHCGEHAGFCAVSGAYNGGFNCDGNNGQLTGNGQGLFVDCTSDEWCSCGSRGWKTNGGSCAPDVCPISANVVVYLR